MNGLRCARLINHGHLCTRDLWRLLSALDALVCREAGSAPHVFSSTFVVHTGGALRAPDGCGWSSRGTSSGAWSVAVGTYRDDVVLWHAGADRWTHGRPLPREDHLDLLEALAYVMRRAPRHDRGEALAWLAANGITPRAYPIRVRARRVRPGRRSELEFLAWRMVWGLAVDGEALAQRWHEVGYRIAWDAGDDASQELREALRTAQQAMERLCAARAVVVADDFQSDDDGDDVYDDDDTPDE